MGRILAIVILLLAYGSLYPFDFHARQLAASPVWLLLHSWPPAMDRSVLVDVVLNVLIYVPAGLFGALSMGKWRAVLLAAALSGSIEMLQLFDDGRLCSTLDLVSNIAGGAAGVWLAQAYGKSVARLLAKSPARAVLRPSAALLLLCCWVGYQTFPLIPYLRLTPFRMKVAELLHPASFSLVQMATAAFEWLAAARLLEEIRLGPRSLALLMLLAPARLFIANRTFTWAELSGAVCAWVVWVTWLSRDERRSQWLAWMAAAVLVVRGLAPFQWQSTPSAFSWMPFAGFLESDKNSAATVFFDKSFLYGTAVWLFSRTGYSLLVSGVAVAGLLAIIEIAQIHLPGRTAEVTDPVYTLVMAALLKLLDEADRRGRARK